MLEVAALALALATPRQPMSCDLPQSLSKSLARRYEGWRVVQASDLSADDRAFWTRARGTACPGAFQAAILPKVGPSYVVSMVRAVHGHLEQVLVVSRQTAEDVVTLVEILEP